MSELSVTPELMEELSLEHVGVSENDCHVIESYIPDTTIPYADNLLHIRMNFHFMNTSDWSNNFTGERGIYYAKELVRYANEKLFYNQKMRLPEGNDTPVYYPGYRYDLQEDGIYFHADDELCFYINEGKSNNYKRDVIDKYSVGEDSILNVFFMVHHPDSVRSDTYSASSAGIALGKSLKLGVKFDPNEEPWRHSSLLNHEVGHVLGLRHTWNLNDGCDDTPKNANCYGATESGRCKAPTSNNMMDYNNAQNAVTPCQIGKMRMQMANLNSRQRDLLDKKWCELDTLRNVIINKPVHWTGAKDLRGNIIIQEGGSLMVSCRLSMPPSSEIRVEPGGELILNEARIYNDCNLQWKGIVVVKEGRNQGKVYRRGAVKLENVKGLPAVAE
ncbi:M43 family zinc metalloprotease [Portibacter marinus]|uniref:M43 family zinc metalloprotease n=1 Tax=Portibacter marinus TaxID=2898660 RepID=UPI001EEED2B2|nr:M43 family zinc metalloprotease [Portibacter marinus]